MHSILTADLRRIGVLRVTVPRMGNRPVRHTVMGPVFRPPRRSVPFAARGQSIPITCLRKVCRVRRSVEPSTRDTRIATDERRTEPSIEHDDVNHHPTVDARWHHLCGWDLASFLPRFCRILCRLPMESLTGRFSCYRLLSKNAVSIPSIRGRRIARCSVAEPDSPNSTGPVVKEIGISTLLGTSRRANEDRYDYQAGPHGNHPRPRRACGYVSLWKMRERLAKSTPTLECLMDTV